MGRLQVVQTLLEAGANVREVNEKGESGLQWAIRVGRSDIVNVLLKAGADPNFRDFDGQTPLFHAIYSGEKACQELLIEAGAQTHNLDGRGRDAAALGGSKAKAVQEMRKLRSITLL